MLYALRKESFALIEALAINGALKPDLNKDGRLVTVKTVAEGPNVGDPKKPGPAKCRSKEAIS